MTSEVVIFITKIIIVLFELDHFVKHERFFYCPVRCQNLAVPRNLLVYTNVNGNVCPTTIKPLFEKKKKIVGDFYFDVAYRS